MAADAVQSTGISALLLTAIDIAPMTPISIFIIAKNEAERIERTIRAVQDIADEIIVVDSGSSDGTQHIAASLGATVIHNDWPGYGAQKRFAQDRCKNDWVFNLDADEVVTPGLKSEIQQLLSKGSTDADAYSIRIVDVLPTDRQPRSFAHSHEYVRLYRKDAGRFSMSPVHDVVEIDEKYIQSRLEGRIHHYSILDISSQIHKYNNYTDLQVADLKERGASLPAWRIFVEFPIAFLKAYLGRRHFLRGSYGFLTAMNYAIFRYLRVAKFYERTHIKKTP